MQRRSLGSCSVSYVLHSIRSIKQLKGKCTISVSHTKSFVHFTSQDGFGQDHRCISGGG